MNKLKDLRLKNQLIILTYIMLFILLIFKPTLIPSIYKRLIVAFKPFIIGGVIAFLINIPMKLIEDKIIKQFTKNNEKINRLSRIIALVVTIVIVFIVINLIMKFIMPQLIQSIKTLTENIPNYIVSLEKYATTNLNKLDVLKNIDFDISSLIQQSISYIGNLINMFVSNLLNFTFGITNFFVNLFLGMIIAIYILLGKEKLVRQFKKLIYAFFSERTCKNILDVLSLTNYKFSRFILGQSTDGIILGTTFFIVFSLVKIPYTLIISIMIPIFNFIPIFGTYVGVIISAFIIVMVKPSSVILFLFLIIIIQQLDGKFVYPMVVGNSLGLSSLWILLAIIVGGNLFGILGMILGIPLVSVMYDLLSQYVNKKIQIKRNVEK